MVSKHSKKKSSDDGLRRQKLRRDAFLIRRVDRSELKRELNIPSIAEQMARSFQMIFRNLKMFLPLLIIGVLVYVLSVGVTGFFTETGGVFAVVVFLFLWLTTIWLVRQIMAKHKVTLRDGIYNSMAPLTSTFVVLMVVAVQCIPLILLVVAYSAAMQTEFLTEPFYALIFLGFAGIMVTISGYLLSSSLISLIAVTAPGIYPMRALTNASELMTGRRLRFLLRVVALMFLLAVIWAVVLLPLAALRVPSVVLNVVIMVLACFSAIYAAVYLYLFYRWLLDS